MGPRRCRMGRDALRLGCVLLLAAGAAVAQTRREPPLPVPPVPPGAPTVRLDDAPLPNRAFDRWRPEAFTAPEVRAGVIDPPPLYRGGTFADGDGSVRDDRLFAPAPGVTVRVPLTDR